MQAVLAVLVLPGAMELGLGADSFEFLVVVLLVEWMVAEVLLGVEIGLTLTEMIFHRFSVREFFITFYAHGLDGL